MSGTRLALLRRIASFAAVGGTGFLVDAGLTEAGVALGLGPYVARLIAVAVAIAVTYSLNRRYTFRAGKGQSRPASYVAVSLATIAVNYAVYAAAMALLPGLRPVLAVAAGSGVGMFLNYIGYSRLVFRHGSDQAA